MRVRDRRCGTGIQQPRRCRASWPMSGSMDDARRLLRHHFGHGEFRPAQRPVIASVLAGRDTLAVLPTGGGKSVCFQVPALVTGGLTLVVSPLIALMQDQVAAASARGIPAAALHSAVGDAEREAIWRGLTDGSLRLLYVSPERLTRLAPELQDRAIRPALLAVDEAHCIAEWGHDFRPSYRTLGAARYRLGRPPAVALTGSATPEVRRDIARALRFRPGRYDEHLGSFDRANLWFGVVPVASERARLEALVRLLADDDRMVIVYAPTRSVTEAIARALAQAGHRAAPYHAGLTRERRSRTLEAFLDDRLDVIVATCAFGMGIDKPRIRLVVHWTLPPTPEAYYQEAGRAGRDGEFARCVLLWRAGDAELHRRQLDVTFPPRALLERLWREGERCAGVPANVRASAERLRHELRPERGRVDWSVVAEPAPPRRGTNRGGGGVRAGEGLPAADAARVLRRASRALLRLRPLPPAGRAGAGRAGGVGATGSASLRWLWPGAVPGARPSSSPRSCSRSPASRRRTGPRWPTCPAWGPRSRSAGVGRSLVRFGERHGSRAVPPCGSRRCDSSARCRMAHGGPRRRALDRWRTTSPPSSACPSTSCSETQLSPRSPPATCAMAAPSPPFRPRPADARQARRGAAPADRGAPARSLSSAHGSGRCRDPRADRRGRAGLPPGGDERARPGFEALVAQGALRPRLDRHARAERGVQADEDAGAIFCRASVAFTDG